jgi:hypothetical protein
MEISAKIGELSELKYLDVSDNSLRKIPSSLGDLKKIFLFNYFLTLFLFIFCHATKIFPKKNLNYLLSIDEKSLTTYAQSTI